MARYDHRPGGLDLTNWDLGAPRSRWSYRHAEELFRTEPLVAGSRPEPTAVAAGGDRLLEISVTTPDGRRSVADEILTGLVSGLHVLVGGRPVLHWDDGVGGRHLWMSVSKVVTSLIIGLLADQDLISYEDPVLEHLPELGPQWQGCRVLDVVDMASGVRCPEVGDPAAYTDPQHPFYRFEASLGWRPADEPTSPYDLVIGFGRTGRPGSTYQYTSVNTFVLAWLIERVTGLTYVTAAQRLLWDQLALDGPAAMCVNRQGVAVSYGGLIMSLDDLARLGTVWTPSSTATGHRVTTPASHLAMITSLRPHLAPQSIAWPHGAHPGRTVEPRVRRRRPVEKGVRRTRTLRVTPAGRGGGVLRRARRTRKLQPARGPVPGGRAGRHGVTPRQRCSAYRSMITLTTAGSAPRGSVTSSAPTRVSLVWKKPRPSR